MPFIKGQSGNPAGRPPGKTNVIDDKIRDFLRDVASDYFFGSDKQLNFKDDLAKLTPTMRTQVLERYLKYFLAPMAALKIEGEVDINQNSKLVIGFDFGDKSLDTDMQNIIANI